MSGAGPSAATKGKSSYRWVVLGIATLCQGSATVAGQGLAPLAPLFQPDLGLTKAEVGLFSTASFVGAWAVMLVAGSITDRFGIRKIASLGQLLAGSLLALMAVTTSVLQAAAVMFAVGLSRGTVFPGATKAVAEWFSPQTRATAMGVKQTGAPLSGIVAAMILPAVGLTFGWRMALAMAGVAIVFSGIASFLLYRNPPSASHSRQHGPGMRDGLGKVVRNRKLWTLGLIAFLLIMGQAALVTYLALYFKESVLLDLIPDESIRVVAAGGYLAICQAGGVFGRVFWGVVADRWFPHRRALVLAMIGAISMMTAFGVGSLGSGCALWLMSGVVFLAGASAIGWNGVYHTLIAETVGPEQIATSAGLSLTIIEFGQIVGAPVFGLIVDLSGSYQAAWYSYGAVAMAGAVVALFASRVRARPAYR